MTDQLEWQDREMGRVLVLAFAIGVPLIFAVVVGMSLLGHISLWTSALVALLPTVFIGPYFGGLVAMGRTSARHEPHASA